jgi:hypothetical protein
LSPCTPTRPRPRPQREGFGRQQAQSPGRHPRFVGHYPPQPPVAWAAPMLVLITCRDEKHEVELLDRFIV